MRQVSWFQLDRLSDQRSNLSRLQRWKRDKSLSFVPPDGRFVLAEYRYSSNAPSTSSRTVGPTSPAPALVVTNLAKDNVSLPFTLKTDVELEAHGGKCPAQLHT
jgi:AP-3 complex subunit mu